MSSLLITQAHLLDPVAGELSDASWLEVADGRIAAMGTGPAPASGEDTRVIDAAGATVMPGLIDAHVHVLLTTLTHTTRRTGLRVTRRCGRWQKPNGCCAADSPRCATSVAPITAWPARSTRDWRRVHG